MSVRVYLSGDPVHDRALKAFYDGIEGPKELVTGWQYKPSKVAVIFGVRKSKVPRSWPRGEIFQRQRDKNLDVIVLETGYINRGDGEHHHYAAGFNGLNGRANFRNENMPDDRAKKLGVELKPWREGKTVVVCGQVPWDASVDHTDHLLWVEAAIERLKAYTDKEIVFRPHPMCGVGYRLVMDVKKSSGRPLALDLEDAHAVVTFNSNAGVEALLEGVPVFAHDQGSMCWAIANRSLISIDVPNRPDRTQWLNDLCYAQWTLDEMRNGDAWKHLTSP